MMARTPLIAGNWKMNTVLDEAKSLAKEVADAAAKAPNVDVAVCVPFPFLVPVGEVLAGTGVGLGAQDCYYEAAGAYTAAVSTSMLKSVGAIGTGLTATPEVAQETHAYIRSWFVENYSQEVADEVIIQYGGSVNDANVDELMACKDIDGALVGGASLKGESFSRIMNFKK